MNWPNSLLWQSTYLLIGRFIFQHVLKQFWCPPLSPCDSILKVPHCIWLCLASLAPFPLEFCLFRVYYFPLLRRSHSKQSIVLVIMLFHYVDFLDMFPFCLIFIPLCKNPVVSWLFLLLSRYSYSSAIFLANIALEYKGSVQW